MKYFILTSDKYSFCLEGYMKLYNRYWNDINNEITILGHELPTVKLPENVSFISLGKQNDSLNWSKTMLDYFSTINDDYFFMCFEDHYLVDFAKIDKITEGINYLKNDFKIDKIYLLPDDSKIKESYNGNYYVAKDEPDALVTTSLLPAIWRKRFLMRLLEYGIKNPHMFEMELNKRTLDCKVIMTKDILYPNLDAMRKGKFNVSIFEQYGKTKSYKFNPYVQKLNEYTIEVFKEMESIYNKQYSTITDLRKAGKLY